MKHALYNKIKPPTKPLDKKRGSVIAAVMTLCIALIVVIASQLNRGVNDRRLIIINKLVHETRNAAESLAEYGHADLIRRFVSRTSFPMNELQTNPISIPSSATTFYANSGIDITKSEVKGGIIPNGYWLYLNPDDPRWEFDPLKGKKIYVREIEIFSKATGYAPEIGNKEVTSYASQVLQVRDSPLFSNAIFYNMDLELHPGPTMNVYGPVHSNRDSWMMAVNNLYFHENLTTSGELLHGSKKRQFSDVHPSSHRGAVKIRDQAGSLKNMKLSGNGSQDSHWLDNRHNEWRTLSSQKWDGYVQDEAHNVPVYNPVGIDDYVPDNPNTATSELQNYAYALIEPLLSKSHSDVKSDTVRNEKFAAKAGLIFKVLEDSTTESGYTIKAYMYDRINDNVPVNPLDPFDGNLALDGSGNPILVEVTLPSGVIGDCNSSQTAIQYDAEPEIYEKNSSSGYVEKGIYDHRQDVALSMITIDIERLREVVDDNANPAGTDLAATYWQDVSGNPTYEPTKDWNGVIYVEFPTVASSGGRADKVVKADIYEKSISYTDSGGTPGTRTMSLGLQLINGSKIPSPTFAADPGMTIATNGPLYVIGNYNADGVAHSNDAYRIETNHYTNDAGAYYDEPPAAVISDTLTILSNDWLPGNADNHKHSAEGSQSNRDAAIFTEVSAAILTGLKPTIPEGSLMEPSSGAQSGGAHNFPRFLEDWDVTLTIRTSMVALFESEVHDKAMPNNYGHYYAPPTRDWGFNDNFRNGIYPPGTPNVRTFRRIKFKDITASEYALATN